MVLNPLEEGLCSFRVQETNVSQSKSQPSCRRPLLSSKDRSGSQLTVPCFQDDNCPWSVINPIMIHVTRASLSQQCHLSQLEKQWGQRSMCRLLSTVSLLNYSAKGLFQGTQTLLGALKQANLDILRSAVDAGHYLLPATLTSTLLLGRTSALSYPSLSFYRGGAGGLQVHGKVHSTLQT